MPHLPPFQEFFHATDFSPACLTAFYHSLSLTVASGGSLTVFHSGYPSESYRKERWPRVRATLSHWGLLEPGAGRDDVAKLGITVKKLQTSANDPVAGIHKQAEREDAELLIMATHARNGLARLFHKEVATPAMRRLRRPALFFPAEARGFVDLETGRAKLQKVLVACDHDPTAEPALRAVGRLITTLGETHGVCREVHVGQTPPLNERPDLPGWSWEMAVLQGDPGDALAQAARDWDADLIALVSRGRDHLADVFLGSTLDQVLSVSPCPVLAVPA